MPETTAKTKKFNEKMLAWRYNLIEKYITPGESVLDLGSGTGWVAKRVADAKGCSVTLTDVLDCNETDLPLKVYDGKTLPFGDKEFDVTLLVFVLHHALNQEEILREAARVTRRRIVIVEDTPRNPFERSVEWFWDTVLSIEHGFFAPHAYRKIEQWAELFKRMSLRLAAQDVVAPFWPFYYTKAVFALDVD
jgi:ubiquinone/menaquinone biosynthesis C-methylase UbiE